MSTAGKKDLYTSINVPLGHTMRDTLLANAKGEIYQTMPPIPIYVPEDLAILCHEYDIDLLKNVIDNKVNLVMYSIQSHYFESQSFVSMKNRHFYPLYHIYTTLNSPFGVIAVDKHKNYRSSNAINADCSPAMYPTSPQKCYKISMHVNAQMH